MVGSNRYLNLPQACQSPPRRPRPYWFLTDGRLEVGPAVVCGRSSLLLAEQPQGLGVCVVLCQGPAILGVEASEGGLVRPLRWLEEGL